MQLVKNVQKVKWHSIASIFADVVVSPWNLLIGGLLISKLTFIESFTSIVTGYTILFIVFYFYGGLGFSKSSKTSELIQPIFGKKITKYGFSTLLAVGQIGWFAVITQIGGTALANLFGVDIRLGILIYAILMYLISSLSLYKMGIVKLLITSSSISLIIFLLVNNYSEINLDLLINSQDSSNSIIWGISIVCFSLISFASVSPDFFSQLNTKKDVFYSSLLGIIIPGITVATLGSILFFEKDLTFEALVGIGAISILGHIFNITTNTDASVAIYTPANRLEYMFGIKFEIALAIAVVFGTLLALLDITSRLE
ncbi:MAG: hypothetical protein ACOCXP_01935, partial [Candidatus Dojkabacteria bacterium]